MRHLLAAAVAFACMAGCERDRGKPQPRPASVIVDITRANSHSGDGMKAFVGAVKPMVPFDESMLLSIASGRLGLVKLDAIDRDAPLHLLVVDDGNKRELVLVAKIGDAKALDEAKTQHTTIETRAGWAAIGRDPATVREIAPYALSTLPVAPAAERPTATIYLAQVMKLHAAAITQLRDIAIAQQASNGPSSDVVRDYIDGLFEATREIDELRITLDASADRADLDMLAIPTAGSRLAAFAALQQAADFTSVAKLPSDPVGVIGVARIASGPYHDGNVKLMTSMYGTSDFARLLDVTTGDIAFTVGLGAGGMTMTQLITITDSHAADAAVAGIKQALAAGKPLASGRLKQTMRSRPETTEHDGITIHAFETTFDASAEPAGQRKVAETLAPGGTQSVRVAVLDRALAYALGGDGDALIGELIDTAKGKRPGYVLPAPAAQMFEAAAARKDSAIMLIDVSMFRHPTQPSAMTAPIALTLGKADTQLRVHVTLPAASLQSVM